MIQRSSPGLQSRFELDKTHHMRVLHPETVIKEPILITVLKTMFNVNEENLFNDDNSADLEFKSRDAAEISSFKR